MNFPVNSAWGQRDERLKQEALFKSDATAPDPVPVTSSTHIQISRRELREWIDDLQHAKDWPDVDLVIDAIDAKL